MAQFQILLPLSATDWRPVTIEFHYAPYGDEQYLWPTFEEAEAARRTLLTRVPDAHLRVAVDGTDIGDLDWQTREKLRFADGTYAPTPWHDEPWYQARHEEHFCHVSTEQPGKIAFTENAAKGQVDRQLVMSPGRYLNRYFSKHLDNNAVEGWCARLSVLLQECALKITQDADEIEDVYVGGPGSCMSHHASDFESYCHPVRAYAGPDTALAYIGSRKDATARSVVWPGRKIYTKIYGDVSRLRLLLEDAGYRGGSLDGARIRRIRDGEGFVIPYLDTGGDLADDGQYLVVGQGGISSDSTDGLAHSTWCCPRCDNYSSPYDRVNFAGGDSEEWCSSCFDGHAIYCDHNRCYYSDDESFVVVHSDRGTNTVLEDSAEDHGAVYLEDRNEWWAKSCCRQCDANGDWFHADDLTEYEGEWLSDSHLPEPLDDADTSAANAHVVAYRQFRDEVAAAEANGTGVLATGEPAGDGREPARNSDDSISAIGVTSSASAETLAHAGA